jgi:multiple antibiotic resistance protein
MLNKFFLVFLPLFVAIDSFGILPIFLNLTAECSEEKIKRIILQSFFTAFAITAIFILIGERIFSFLGVKLSDFLIAGGIILLLLSITDLLFPEKKRRYPLDEVGIVPLGTPLIAGPAVLTTSLLMTQKYGISVTLFAFLINLILTSLLFLIAKNLCRWIGRTGLNAISKITSLILASISIMWIREGIYLTLKGYGSL